MSYLSHGQPCRTRSATADALVAFLRRLRSHAGTAIVSNACPHMRAEMIRAGLLDIADEVVLSCEIGHAKPDARIYAAALHRLAAEPADALFIDDTPGHVTAAAVLGMTGHLDTSTISTITRIEELLRPDKTASLTSCAVPVRHDAAGHDQ